MRTRVNTALVIAVLIFTARQSSAQEFETFEVVTADSLKKELLYGNLKSWLAAEPRKGTEKWTKIDLDSVSGTIDGDYEFLVYSQSGLLKKVSGVVSFHLRVETKDFKYRYQFSGFVFHYMKQDRNYIMVKTGKTKSLAEVEAKGWQASWNSHRKTTAAKVREQSAEMKAMAKKRVIVKSPVATTKTDW